LLLKQRPQTQASHLSREEKNVLSTNNREWVGGEKMQQSDPPFSISKRAEVKKVVEKSPLILYEKGDLTVGMAVRGG